MLKIIYKFVIYSGVLAFISLVGTAFLGITGLNFRLHRVMGIVTFCLALLHVVLIIYRNIMIKRNIKKQQAMHAQQGGN
ncbi:MAG: hypothetical protein V1653_04915 [bacterium]